MNREHMSQLTAYNQEIPTSTCEIWFWHHVCWKYRQYVNRFNWFCNTETACSTCHCWISQHDIAIANAQTQTRNTNLCVYMSHIRYRGGFNQIFSITDCWKFWRLTVILSDCNSQQCPLGGRCVKWIRNWLRSCLDVQVCLWLQPPRRVKAAKCLTFL